MIKHKTNINSSIQLLLNEYKYHLQLTIPIYLKKELRSIFELISEFDSKLKRRMNAFKKYIFKNYDGLHLKLVLLGNRLNLSASSQTLRSRSSK